MSDHEKPLLLITTVLNGKGQVNNYMPSYKFENRTKSDFDQE